jgi:hypothetical protein
LHFGCEAFDSEIVLIRLFLVQSYERKEEVAGFAMVLVMREEIQGVVVVVVPLAKGTQSPFLYVQSYLLIF